MNILSSGQLLPETGLFCQLPPFSGSHLSQNGQVVVAMAVQPIATGSMVVSRFNGANISACAEFGLVQAQSFYEN